MSNGLTKLNYFEISDPLNSRVPIDRTVYPSKVPERKAMEIAVFVILAVIVIAIFLTPTNPWARMKFAPRPPHPTSSPQQRIEELEAQVERLRPSGRSISPNETNGRGGPYRWRPNWSKPLAKETVNIGMTALGGDLIIGIGHCGSLPRTELPLTEIRAAITNQRRCWPFP